MNKTLTLYPREQTQELNGTELQDSLVPWLEREKNVLKQCEMPNGLCVCVCLPDIFLLASLCCVDPGAAVINPCA